MSLAEDLRADVAAFIGDLGRAVTLRRLTPGTYDPATGSGGTSTTKDYTGNARVGDYSDTVRDGTMIKDSDRRATFLPDDTTLIPAIGDSFIVGSVVFTIVNARKLREVNGTTFAWTLQIRQ